MSVAARHAASAVAAAGARVIDGVRLVPRSTKILRVFVKRRWFGRTVTSALSEEFPVYDRTYCARALGDGTLRVERAGVVLADATSAMLGDHDVICHDKHHHEPPVFDAPVHIVHEDAELLVVSKPGTMPVHPTSNYWHSTVLHALYASRPELATPGLFPIHRLDRLTSGVLVFAKTTAASLPVFAAFREGLCAKEYVAEVHGHFAPAGADASGWVECAAPIGRSFVGSRSHYGVDSSARGKASLSLFRLVAYDAGRGVSVVQARPITGRTHQLRIHLAALGFPIVGDAVYGAPSTAVRQTSPALLKAVAAMARVPGCPLCGADESSSYEARILAAMSPPISLHAAELAVTLAGNRQLRFRAPPPSWLPGG